MIARTEAEEHLRVIRSLMEKATIYRALSAPSALVGGLLSLAASAFLMWKGRQESVADLEYLPFTIVWTIVFTITAVVSFALIARDAQRRSEPFLSIGFRSAMEAALPSMLVAAVFTITSFARHTIHEAVPWWISFYGLALLSMAHFAPRSIALLGWAFLATGAAAMVGDLDTALSLNARFGANTPVLLDGPCILMACTFGLFHLVYAACTWPHANGPSS